MNDASKRLADLSPEQKRALLARLLKERAQQGGKGQAEFAPLSQQQRALWFLYQLAPESSAYNLLYTARIRSALDISALQQALLALVRRYPILTATYTMRDGEPVQCFHPQQEVHAEVVDATSWSAEALEEHLLVEGNRPFDLEKGPIVRPQIFKLGEREYVLALTVHHIALDFWSLDILVDELYLLYAAQRAGTEDILPPPGPNFTEYVRWQREMLESAEGERLWSYWKQKLSGELPVLGLPTDRPRPAVQTYGGASHSFPISDELTGKLRELAASEKVTLYTLVLAAFKTLLYRYSHQEDILVGTPMLGRNKAELERIVGYLVNPVTMRTDFAGNPTFRELLARVRTTVMEALDHQDYPFPLLVEKLQPKRDPSYSPIFQSLFIWDRPRKRDGKELERAGLTGPVLRMAQELELEPYIMGQQGAPFDLTLTIFEVDGSLSADFRYNVDLFDRSTLQRLERHFLTLLESVTAQPDQRVQELPLLTEEERQQILYQWNATEAPFPETATVHQLVEEQVKRTPDAEALTFEGVSLSYRELNRRANLLARELQSHGVGPDVLVGVCMERSIEMVVALLGVLKAGGAYVPLDPDYPQERLAYMVEDAQVPVLLTQEQLRQRLPETSARVICLHAGWGADSEEEVVDPVTAVGPEHLAYMIYTSGSTGRPKGVMNTHRGVCNRLYWMQQAYQLTADDRVMQKTPFSFDVSVWEFFWPLQTGACLVMARPGGQQDPAYLARLIEEQRITTMHFVPSMLHAFLLEAGLEERCQSLRRVICSGEALTYDLQERFFARLNANLYNLYGPTEAAIDVTAWTCQREGRDKVVPIGRPIANTQIYILDEGMQPVPIGVTGELYIGGVGVARGYHNRPELTAEKFVHDPFSGKEHARLFKTGDLARYRVDGTIEFLGRIDYQIKLRGFRIELGEIEAELGQHPAVKEAVVVAREDMPGHKRLVAYLVPKQATASSEAEPQRLSPQDAGISLEELRSYLLERLPYYMVPASFLFLDRIPLTPNGKVDRRALPAPDQARPELEAEFVPPRTATEEKLAQIWTEVLGLEKVGVHDNYFDLGGASIQSLEMIARAKEQGLEFPLERLFEYQTIAELAAALDKEQQAPETVSNDEPVEQQADEVHIVEPQPAAPTTSEAQREQVNTIIESIGVYLPPKAVTTDELLQNCKRPIRFPLARLTGIKSRRMAGETEFSIDIARKAVSDCFDRSKYRPEDIDMIICGNISRCDRPGMQFTFEPGTAVRLKHYFGMTNAIAFDVDNACTGLFTAANIVDAFLQAGLIRRGMVVSGEYITHLSLTAQKELSGFMDSRLPCMTVGDAGAAMILERAHDQSVGFHAFDMFSLGRFSWDCIAKATDQPHGGAIMYTDAVNVSAVNMKYAVAHAANIIAQTGFPHDSFQHVIIHQTSGTTIRDAAREINRYYGKEVCTQENVINNIAERGNTATTTHIVALMDHIRSGRIQSGDNVVFGITGSGATIGAAIYTFDDLPDRMRKVDAGELPEKVTPAPVALSVPAKRVRVESVGTVPLGMKVESVEKTLEKLGDIKVKKQVLEMVKVAAERAFTGSSVKRNDIDLMIYSGVYRDELVCEPAIAALLQGELGINDLIETPEEKKTFALDVFNGSIGFLNACHAATGMIQGQKAKTALVMAAEIENNREVAPDKLLGIEETASVVVLDESPDGKTGFGNFVFKYFTDYVDSFDAHCEYHDGKMVMVFNKDPRLESYYIACIQEAVKELLEREQLDLSRIKCILPPQISSSFVEELGKTLGVAPEKMVDVRAEHDLYTSSLPFALQQVREQQLAQPGDIGLIIAVGSGIQVGCATYYF
uniref:Carrier domain-containing protein n=1 Tax=Thermosporothrix sp. COM3 TaxID=2490863 RepID=A0A455T0B7_9CHLR|nr:hypothetical protein KTC_55450 [Thermosporothrix sp. COM3]